MTTEEYAKKVVENSSQWPWTEIKDKVSKETLMAERQKFFSKIYHIEILLSKKNAFHLPYFS